VSFILTCHCRRPVFVEVKSRAGIASKVQKGVRAEVMAAGAECWMARSARAALMALRLSGVVFGGHGSRLNRGRGRVHSPTRRSGCRKPQRWRLIDGRSHGETRIPSHFCGRRRSSYSTVKTENRLRASDHRALFDQFGFEIVAERDCVMVEGGSAVETEKPFELRPWVTSAMRD
jgi:hypothetical protein